MDMWGSELSLAAAATAAEQQAFEDAMDSLSMSATGTVLIANVWQPGEMVVVELIDDHDDEYVPRTNTLYWDPGSGLVTGSGAVQSPALGLAHELGHAQQDLSGALKGKPTVQIEAENLSDTENPIARELGEPQRRNYYDAAGVVRTEGPVSRTPAIEGQRSSPSSGAVYRTSGGQNNAKEND